MNSLSNIIENLFWNLYARSYSNLAESYKPYQEVMAIVMAEFVCRANREGEVVFDSGCGTGDYSSYLTELGYKVIGLDISPSMINVAKRKSDKPLFIIGDLNCALPISSNSVDHIISINNLYVIQRSDYLVVEWRRILKKDGLLHLVNFCEPLNLKEMNKQYFSRYGLTEYLKMIKNQFVTGLFNLYIQTKMNLGSYAYWSEEHHKTALGSVGFEILSCHRTYICDYDVHIIAKKTEQIAT